MVYKYVDIHVLICCPISSVWWIAYTVIVKMSKTPSANKLSFDYDFDLLFHFISATAFCWGYMAPAIIFPNERVRLFPSAIFIYT